MNSTRTWVTPPLEPVAVLSAPRFYNRFGARGTSVPVRPSTRVTLTSLTGTLPASMVAIGGLGVKRGVWTLCIDSGSWKGSLCRVARGSSSCGRDGRQDFVVRQRVGLSSNLGTGQSLAGERERRERGLFLEYFWEL